MRATACTIRGFDDVINDSVDSVVKTERKVEPKKLKDKSKSSMLKKTLS
jgi:hypothetical protein